MTELSNDVKTVLITAICDCGEEMECLNYVLTSYPPLFPHECPMCGKKENLTKKYPTIEYIKL